MKSRYKKVFTEIPIKYFIFFIIGLLILNFILSVYIPILEYASLDANSPYVKQVFFANLAWFVTSWILVAPTGGVLIPGFLFLSTPFDDLVVLRITAWIFAMVSIPLTIKLTPKLPKISRIFLTYFIAVNIASIGFIIWNTKFGG